MVELKIKSGSTEQTKRVILALLAAATPEKIAEVCLKEKADYSRQDKRAKECTLTISLHLDEAMKDGQYTLASAGDIQIVTDEFSIGFLGTGPKDLLEVLRGAGITPEMLPDESITTHSEKRMNVRFSSRYYSYGKLREVSPSRNEADTL